MKRLIVLLLMCTSSISALAERLILIHYDVNTDVKMFVDKDSIRKVENMLYVELLFDMGNENPMFIRTQRLFNCRARESTLLKMGINNQPMEPPKGIAAPAYVPADGSSYAKVFEYVCSVR